ncbi:hypothetical protein IAG44_39880 [Streptomyces roseirectus]|uniref:Uncharacterized protein n=1 Tax=Streptomyces roseirectus TaxID=2768066 RepID=A0A7H0IQA8_9ACTN|nr:hypothetical protein [Streptomyces roseirectus]QNP74974.1 hypothetical protein IAG44_39880 [Streptomyces roseirectus]
MDHATDVGRATAVTDTPGTEAVADTTLHAPRPTHSHVGKFTNCSAAGLASIRGDGNLNCSRATWASCAGEGTRGPPSSC